MLGVILILGVGLGLGVEGITFQFPVVGSTVIET
jgi:hypothetical protein